MADTESESRRRRAVEQYLANERLNETTIDEPEPTDLDIDEIFNQPRQPHILERLTYFLVLATLVLCVVNYSGPYLVYLKLAYGFHTDDLVFEPNEGPAGETEEGTYGAVDPDILNAGEKFSENVYKMDSGSQTQDKINLLCDNILDVDKFDCHPENNPTQEKCEKRGCCWKAVTTRKRDTVDANIWAKQAPVGVPFCYYPNNYPGYIVSTIKKTDTGFRITMSRSSKSYYPRDVTTLQMDVIFATKETLRMKIYDPSQERFEVPLPTPTVTTKASPVDYDVILSTSGQPFRLVVKRKSTGAVLLNTTGAFIFSDQLIQLSYILPSSFLYGLGEHRDSLLHSFNWTRFTMWTKDHYPEEGVNLYGDHPFYLSMEEDGSSHGVFLLNSNAMDVVLQPSPAITWRTIGGVIDLYMFLGPTPEGVVQQYTAVIGRPFMPPYWGLGFHQCRWGYTTVNETLAVVDRIKAYGIPQDVQWNDIDYARDELDFTTGLDTFGDQGAMVEELHRRGLHYVMMVDPAISSTQPPGTYPPYDVGLQRDVFVKDSAGKPLHGKMWPGQTVWPDFTNPRTHDYWTEMVQAFHKHVRFDGMWIDMNEPANFVDGSLAGCPSPSDIEDPPYVPAVDGGSLRHNTLCATAQHHWGLHYNTHSLYGLAESNASQSALKVVRGKRPFVISRATFSGQGHFGGHWNGDNNSTFYDLYKSIAEILNMNMFGITLTGSDICGFRGNSTAELCRRWQQLGAFYPFARNHNNQGNRDQDPAAFGASVAESSRKALETRYLLLPYLYTLFHLSHVTGSTVARPLFFEFPGDKATYSIDQQFLWGAALLISPVLKGGALSVNGYFPAGLWYDLHTGLPVTSAGQMINLSAPLDLINLHARAGFILPTQSPATTTTESRQNMFEVRAYLDSDGVAEGGLYWDDGDSIDTYEKGEFNFIKFYVRNSLDAVKMVLNDEIQIPSKPIGSSSTSDDYGSMESVTTWTRYSPMPRLGSAVVYGVQALPQSVKLNGVSKPFTFNDQILTVTELSADLLQHLILTWG